MKLTITLPLPPACLSPNARVHWRVKAKATKAYRMLSRLSTLGSMVGMIGADEAHWQTANVRCAFFFSGCTTPGQR